jgi:hypothetical protein
MENNILNAINLRPHSADASSSLSITDQRFREIIRD